MNFSFTNYINDYLDGTGRSSSATLYDGGADTAAALSVGAGSFSALSDFAVANIRGVGVTESQTLYFGANVRYDESSSYSVIADKPRAAYALSFNSALPLCWDTSNTSSSCGEADRIEANTVIRMLGSDWLVLDYTVSGENVTSVTLGKVLSSATGLAQGGVLWIGSNSNATLSEFSLTGAVKGVPKLASFKVETPAGGSTAQLFAGNHVNVSGVSMRVNRIYLDENSTARADVTAMSKVVTLSKGVSLDTSMSNFWYADISSSIVGNSSAISRILLYSMYPTVTTGDKFLANNSMTILPGEPGFEFSYLGLSATPESYDTLVFHVLNITAQYSESGYWSGPFVELISGVPDAFRYSSGDTVVNRSMIRISLSQMAGTTGVIVPAGTPMIQNTSGYWLALPSIPSYTYSSSESAPITFNYSADQCILCVTDYASDGSGDARYLCALIDPAQGNGGQFANADGSPAATMIGYSSAANSLPSKAANFMTDRGSRIITVDPNRVLIEYAKSAIRGQFMVKNVVQNATYFAPAVTRAPASPATGLVVANPACWCKGNFWCFWCK